MFKPGLKLAIAIILLFVSALAISFSRKTSQKESPKIVAISLSFWAEVLDSNNKWHPFLQNEIILAETDSFTILQIPARQTFSKMVLNKETGEDDQIDSTVMRNTYIITRFNTNTGYKFDSLKNNGEPIVVNTAEQMGKNTISSLDSSLRNATVKFHFILKERKGNIIRNYFHTIDSTGKLSTDTLICEYEVGKKQNMRFVFSKILDTIPGATFNKLIFLMKGDPKAQELKYDRKHILSAEKVPASRVDDISALLEKVRQMERKKSN